MSSSGSPRLPFPLFLKFWVQGTILSAIAYGVAATLFFACLYLLRRTTRNIRKPLQITLFVYITFMFTLSTISISSGVATLLSAIPKQAVDRKVLVGATPSAVTIVLANWGADGFLLWRCAVLYEGTPTTVRRIVTGAVYLLGLMSLGIGCLYLATNFAPKLQSMAFHVFFWFAGITLLVNLVITSLVSARLYACQRKLKKTLGAQHAGPYAGVIAMCVESALVIIIACSVFLALQLVNRNPFTFSREFLIHIYVIAPLLIIYRVAQGKAFSNSSTSSYSGQDVEMSRPSRFQSQTGGLSTGGSTRIEIQTKETSFTVVDDASHDYKRPTVF